MRNNNRFQKFSMINTQPDENQSKITESLAIIKQLYELRLVEKLSRPWTYLQKQKLYIAYRQKFLYLHQLLSQIQKQYRQQNLQVVPKPGKKSKTTTANNTRYYKQQILKIEAAYNEVFILGSFRYYYRVAKAFGVPTDLDSINIEEWSSETLKDQPGNKCC